ncbi:MAG TPA: hypothetical protein VGJ60_07690 [Chloroflexota bacterium]
MFPRNTFARHRITRYLRHRYTRVPVVDVLDSGQVPEDPDGLDDYNQPEMTYGTPVPNQPCLYEAAGNQTSTRLVRTDHGTELVDRPILFVAYGDPLQAGDEVHDVRDSEGHIYVKRGVAEEPADIAPGGPRVYQSWLLRETTTPHEPG